MLKKSDQVHQLMNPPTNLRTWTVCIVVPKQTLVYCFALHVWKLTNRLDMIAFFLARKDYGSQQSSHFCIMGASLVNRKQQTLGDTSRRVLCESTGQTKSILSCVWRNFFNGHKHYHTLSHLNLVGKISKKNLPLCTI